MLLQDTTQAFSFCFSSLWEWFFEKQKRFEGNQSA